MGAWRRVGLLVLCGVLALVWAGCGRGEGEQTFEAVSRHDLGSAPGFTLADLNGDPVALSDFAGQPIVLDFWATWCPPCVEEVPSFVELYDENRGRGLVVLGVALRDKPEDVRAFAQTHGVTYPMLLGEDAVVDSIVEGYGGIEYIPTTFFIRRDGTIAQRVEGLHSKEQLKQLVRLILPPS